MAPPKCRSDSSGVRRTQQSSRTSAFWDTRTGHFLLVAQQPRQQRTNSNNGFANDHLDSIEQVNKAKK